MTTKITPFRNRFKHKKRQILFICTGNTCRSPMAAYYFRKLLAERNIKNIEVRSAGVMTITGLLASQEAVQVMGSAHVDLSRHRSSQLSSESIRKADLILAMTPFHRQTALRLTEVARKKTYLLKEFAGSDLKNVQITDPMGCTLEVFKRCFREIKQACERLIEHDFFTGKTVVPKPKPPKTETRTASARKKTAKKEKPKQPQTAAAKKDSTKKTESKKAVAKKKADKKSTAKKESAGAKPTATKSAPKRPTPKKTTPQKTAPKQAAPKKPAPKQVAKKKAVAKPKKIVSAKPKKTTAGSRRMASGAQRKTST